ncbi:hypothetical protein HanRHA438_Chr10g0457191 [Helianthus annuus]|nr:hypothetical protein HanRHA438_Chr10g0457191 [Helianthus annuus]
MGTDLVISVFEDSPPSLDSPGTTTEFHKSSKDLSNWKILGASLHEAVRYMMVSFSTCRFAFILNFLNRPFLLFAC